jgi:hypothetical protein
MPRILADFIEYGANAAFWAPIGVVFITSFVWPWWKSFWGINITSFEAALAFALLPFVMNYDFGVRIANSLLFAWAEGCALWLMAFVSVWRGYLIIDEQLRRSMGVGVPGAVRIAARLGKDEALPPDRRADAR